TRLFGFNLFSVFFDVHQIGPAYVVLRFKTNLFGIPVQGAFLQFLRPIGPMRNAIIHQVYTDSSLAAYIFSKFLIFAESKMVNFIINLNPKSNICLVFKTSLNVTYKYGIVKPSSVSPI